MVSFIDNVEGLIFTLLPVAGRLRDGEILEQVGLMHCSTCSEDCRMNIGAVNYEDTYFEIYLLEKKSKGKVLRIASSPSVFSYSCVNCHSSFWSYVYPGIDLPCLVIFPKSHLISSTQNTPENVAYFLNQAYLAQLGSAFSAAMGMYRTALDQMLDGKGSLAEKIDRLRNAIEQGSAPKWARKLNPLVLDLMKEAGDIQMHANSLEKLESLTAEKLHRVQGMMTFLLKQKYEVDRERNAALESVRAALAKKNNSTS